MIQKKQAQICSVRHFQSLGNTFAWSENWIAHNARCCNLALGVGFTIPPTNMSEAQWSGGHRSTQNYQDNYRAVPVEPENPYFSGNFLFWLKFDFPLAL